MHVQGNSTDLPTYFGEEPEFSILYFLFKCHWVPSLISHAIYKFSKHGTTTVCYRVRFEASRDFDVPDILLDWYLVSKTTRASKRSPFESFVRFKNMVDGWRADAKQPILNTSREFSILRLNWWQPLGHGSLEVARAHVLSSAPDRP